LAGDKYNLENFTRIESDAQFKQYENFIFNFYNYAGLHLGEKIDGNDQGEFKLWLPK